MLAELYEEIVLYAKAIVMYTKHGYTMHIINMFTFTEIVIPYSEYQSLEPNSDDIFSLKRKRFP